MNGVLVTLAIRCLIGSVIAVGGANALIPQIRTETVAQLHWLDDRTFAQLVALAQAVPGPNMLLVPLIGWRVGGWIGALIALVAFLAPSCTIAVVASRLLHRHGALAPIAMVRRTFRPIAVGLLVASSIAIVEVVERATTTAAAHIGLPVVAVVVAYFASTTKINPLVYLGGAAVAGLIIPMH